MNVHRDARERTPSNINKAATYELTATSEGRNIPSHPPFTTHHTTTLQKLQQRISKVQKAGKQPPSSPSCTPSTNSNCGVTSVSSSRHVPSSRLWLVHPIRSPPVHDNCEGVAVAVAVLHLWLCGVDELREGRLVV